MTNNLIETVWGYFNEPVVAKAAEYLNEPEEVIRKVLGSVIPVTLSGIIAKAESGDTETIVRLANAAFKTDILKHRINTFTQPGGGVPSYAPDMISDLFGDKAGKIQNAISSYFETKGTTAASLIGTIVPVTFAVIGKFISEKKLSQDNTVFWLAGQKAEVMSAIPVGSGLAGFFTVERPFSPPKENIAPAPIARDEKKTNWWLPVIVLLFLALLLWWLLKGKDDKPATVVQVHDTIQVNDTVIVEKLPVKLTLPNGVIIDAYKGSIEDLLIAFLLDADAKPGNDNWFDFTDLNFTTGTAEIIPETKKELDNIIEILKAFPNVKVKLGGYTDKVGDAAFNKKLSLERAKAVEQAIKDAGLGSQVTGAEGYGSEFAKYPESAPEADRVKDRHVSVSVRQK
jgi:outer membrane protein OmpA-like peptidoglycan-associated protein